MRPQPTYQYFLNHLLDSFPDFLGEELYRNDILQQKKSYGVLDKMVKYRDFFICIAKWKLYRYSHILCASYRNGYLGFFWKWEWDRQPGGNVDHITLVC